MFIELRKTALLLMIAPALLAGCGGSGSQGVEGTSSQLTYSGVVVDGYLQGATVFVDLNRNGVFDAGEPATTTDSNGQYSLKLPADVYNPPVIVDVPATAVDADTGKQVGVAYRMAAPDGKFGVITPVTTMVKGVMDSNPGLRLTDAEEIVRGYLRLSDTYELYADYSLTTRPTGFDSGKWARFRAEAGRAHNIGRVAALALGKYWQQVRNSYGGNIPPEKMAYIQALLSAQSLRAVSPVAETLPNNGQIDLATVTVGDFDLSLAQIETYIRQISQASAATLSNTVAQGPLHMIPFRNAEGNYMHFRLANGGGSATATTTIDSQGKVILPDLTETDTKSMQAVGSNALFSGGLEFDTNSGYETLYEAGKSMRLRMFRLPIAGELQSGVIDGTWLRDRNAVWPPNAVAYKMQFRSIAAMLTYLNDPTQLQSGDPITVLQACCGTSSEGKRIGDLALKFGPGKTDINGTTTGELQLASYADGTAKPLETTSINSGWSVVSGFGQPRYVSLTIPSAYIPLLNNAGADRLFSAFGANVGLAFATITSGKFAMVWNVPSGRFIDVIALNDAAYNALKPNLKW